MGKGAWGTHFIDSLLKSMARSTTTLMHARLRARPLKEGSTEDYTKTGWGGRRGRGNVSGGVYQLTFVSIRDDDQFATRRSYLRMPRPDLRPEGQGKTQEEAGEGTGQKAFS